MYVCVCVCDIKSLILLSDGLENQSRPNGEEKLVCVYICKNLKMT